MDRAVEEQDSILVHVDRRFVVVVDAAIARHADSLAEDVGVGRAGHHVHLSGAHADVGGSVNALSEVDVVVDVLLFEIRQDLNQPTHVGLSCVLFAEDGAGRVLSPRRQHLMPQHVVLQSETDLHQVVLALRPSCGFARLLNGGKQQCDQHGDDGDHDEQLNQREAASAGVT